VTDLVTTMLDFFVCHRTKHKKTILKTAENKKKIILFRQKLIRFLIEWFLIKKV